MKKKKLRACTGIWLDHSTAYILNISDSQPRTIKLRSRVPSIRKATGGSRKALPYAFDGGGDDHKLKNKIQNATKSFFQKIDAHLEKDSTLLIMGPALAKKEFLKYLENKRNSPMYLETTSRLTERQFQAKVKNFFKVSLKGQFL